MSYCLEFRYDHLEGWEPDEERFMRYFQTEDEAIASGEQLWSDAAYRPVYMAIYDAFGKCVTYWQS